jgi:predicted nucleotidyltransferase
MSEIDFVKNEFINHGVSYVALFGSRASNQAAESSDYDFLIEFNPEKKHTLLDIADLKMSLEQKLNAPVDLVTTKALHPYIKNSVLANLQVIYDNRA